MTIKEVARLAGVSSAAVSRYFNGGSLSEEKKERIRQVVEETEYVPNLAAHVMRTGRSRLIGIVVPHIHSDSLSQMMSGIVKATGREGYTCILGYSGGSIDREIRIIEGMKNNQMEGIILMGTGTNKKLRKTIEECHIPLVVTGQSYPNIPSVFHDDENAMRDLTGRMLKKRKNIAFIGVSEDDPAAGKARRVGVEKAFKDAGRDPKELIRATADFSVNNGYEVTMKLLREHPEIDGIIAASDLIAHGALRALRETGRKVPKDCGIAGVGDYWADETSDPPLTSVKLYFQECGEAAAKLLFEMLRAEKGETGSGPVPHIKYGYAIVERGSF